MKLKSHFTLIIFFPLLIKAQSRENITDADENSEEYPYNVLKETDIFDSDELEENIDDFKVIYYAKQVSSQDKRYLVFEVDKNTTNYVGIKFEYNSGSNNPVQIEDTLVTSRLSSIESSFDIDRFTSNFYRNYQNSQNYSLRDLIRSESSDQSLIEKLKSKFNLSKLFGGSEGNFLSKLTELFLSLFSSNGKGLLSNLVSESGRPGVGAALTATAPILIVPALGAIGTGAFALLGGGAGEIAPRGRGLAVPGYRRSQSSYNRYQRSPSRSYQSGYRQYQY